MQEYIEYACAAKPKNVPNLSVVFAICRDVSEGQDYWVGVDPCLKILRSLIEAGVNLEECIGRKELANWSRRQLRFPEGLSILMEVLRGVEDAGFGAEVAKGLHHVAPVDVVE